MNSSQLWTKLLGLLEKLVPAFLLELNYRKQKEINRAKYEAKKARFREAHMKARLDNYEKYSDMSDVDIIDDYLSDKDDSPDD